MKAALETGKEGQFVKTNIYLYLSIKNGLMSRFRFRKSRNWWQRLQNSFKRWFSRRVKPKPKGGKPSHGKNNTSSCLGKDKIAVSEGGKTPIVWRVKKGFVRTNCTSMTCSQEKAILPIFHSG